MKSALISLCRVFKVVQYQLTTVWLMSLWKHKMLIRTMFDIVNWVVDKTTLSSISKVHDGLLHLLATEWLISLMKQVVVMGTLLYIAHRTGDKTIRNYKAIFWYLILVIFLMKRESSCYFKAFFLDKIHITSLIN